MTLGIIVECCYGASDLCRVSRMLSVAYAECRKLALGAECRYAEWDYAECHYAECRGALPS